jgi:hypothetical protein
MLLYPEATVLDGSVSILQMYDAFEMVHTHVERLSRLRMHKMNVVSSKMLHSCASSEISRRSCFKEIHELTE